MSNAEKLKALKLTIDKIDKDYGKGSVMMMNERNQDPMEVISTGSIGLDAALGVGGLPKGRVIEIYGPESSGKTTVAIHVIAEAQKKGGMCAFIDAEHAFDSAYAKKLGVDVDNLLISQPDYGEQALEIADRLILSGALDVVVIDSVAALVPKSELEGEMGDSNGDAAVGNHVKVKVVKNKVAPPFRAAEFDIIFGEGISKMGEIVDMGVELGIVNKSGSWFSYESNKLGQGRESVKGLLHDNPELANEIEAKIRAKINEVKIAAEA